VNTGIRFAINATIGSRAGAGASSGQRRCQPTTKAESAAQVGTPDQQSLDRTKAATDVAVNDAIMAAIEATRLDLDIRLIGRTSIIVAAGK
jgi:hypothetical protein